MALSLLVMVLNVSIYFVFDSVERVRNDAVVVSVLFEKFVNECNNNSEPATNESNDHALSHVIDLPDRSGLPVANLIRPKLQILRRSFRVLRRQFGCLVCS